MGSEASHYELSLNSKSICAKIIQIRCWYSPATLSNKSLAAFSETCGRCATQEPGQMMHNKLKIKASISLVCFNFAMISVCSSPLLLLLKIIFLTGRSVFNYDIHGVQQWACAPLALLLLFVNLSNFTLFNFHVKALLRERLQESVMSFQISRGDFESLGLEICNGVCVRVWGWSRVLAWTGDKLELWTGILILYNYCFTHFRIILKLPNYGIPHMEV